MIAAPLAQSQSLLNIAKDQSTISKTVLVSAPDLVVATATASALSESKVPVKVALSTGPDVTVSMAPSTKVVAPQSSLSKPEII